jgi:dynein heavy chain
MRDIESMFPNAMTVYDYYINHERQEWGLWDEKVGSAWKPSPNQPFHKMFVPTADTVRNRYVI